MWRNTLVYHSLAFITAKLVGDAVLTVPCRASGLLGIKKKKKEEGIVHSRSKICPPTEDLTGYGSVCVGVGMKGRWNVTWLFGWSLCVNKDRFCGTHEDYV